MPLTDLANGRLLIIADDLTGAADTAARCRQAGLAASIFLRAPAPPLPAGAVALTTDSRHLPPALAAKTVRASIDSLARRSQTLWYKKIDSTLRGNIGAELDAMLDVLESGYRRAFAVISPAFPAQHRGLRDGYLVRDAVAPSTLRLPDLLAEQSRRKIGLIKSATVRGDGLADAIATGYRSGAQLLVIDAMTEDDLARIVAAAGRATPHALFCGSAGLVGVLAAQMAETANGAPVLDVSISEPRTVLAVVGSGSKTARAQIHASRACGGVNSIEIDENGVATAITTASAKTGRWLLSLPEPLPGTVLDGPDARRLASLLADHAMAMIRDLRPDTIILGGGDTAIHVLERLNVQRLNVLAELLPGMPLTRAPRRSGYTPLIVLKAGNHGDAKTLIKLLHFDAEYVVSCIPNPDPLHSEFGGRH